MPFDTGPSMPIPDPRLEGLAAESDRALGEALTAVVPAPMKPYNAKVVDALAKALADRDREQARRLLDQALAVADRWGYRPLSEQAGALLRELSSD